MFEKEIHQIMHYSGHFPKPSLIQINYIKKVLKYYSRSLISKIHFKYQQVNFTNLSIFLKFTTKSKLIIKLIENLQVTDNNHLYDKLLEEIKFIQRDGNDIMKFNQRDGNNLMNVKLNENIKINRNRNIEFNENIEINRNIKENNFIKDFTDTTKEDKSKILKSSNVNKYSESNINKVNKNKYHNTQNIIYIDNSHKTNNPYYKDNTQKTNKPHYINNIQTTNKPHYINNIQTTNKPHYINNIQNTNYKNNNNNIQNTNNNIQNTNNNFTHPILNKEHILDKISSSLDKETYKTFTKCRKTIFSTPNIQKFIGYKFKEDKKILSSFFNLLFNDLIFEIIQEGIFKRNRQMFLKENDDELCWIEICESVFKVLQRDTFIN